jgi:uncharacterized protein YwgA
MTTDDEAAREGGGNNELIKRGTRRAQAAKTRLSKMLFITASLVKRMSRYYRRRKYCPFFADLSQ